MNKESLAVPIAIVVAAALIAGAIFLKQSNTEPVTATNGTTENQKPDIKTVTADDHILGDPNAPILLVEYTDYDCPFCDIFHDTMRQIMAEYGAEGKVAWVFRHFPIDQLHPNAPKISEASECVTELGGNDAFWKFTDAVFDSKIVDQASGKVEFTDMAKIADFAATAGVDRAAFTSCLDSGKYGDQIAEDVNEAIKAGGKGTPHTVVVVGDQMGLINGAQPYEEVKDIIDNLLAQTEGNSTAN